MSGLEKSDDLQQSIEEGPSRYAAFAARLRTLITASSRYIAYSSDIGEAFRPLTNPLVVRGAYGISWAYILGDCGYAGYLAHKERQGPLAQTVEKTIDAMTPAQKVELRKRQMEGKVTAKDETALPDIVKYNPLESSAFTHVGLVVARRAVFQSLASMALPAFTIHSIVRYSAPLFAKATNPRVRASGPTVAGLAAVPALPFLFDKPVEHVIDTAFDWVEQQMAEAKAKAKKVLDKKTQSALPPGPPSEDEDKGRSKISTAVAAAAVVGVGVDLFHLPRIRTLLARHAKRLTLASHAAPERTAAMALAKRIMHESEWKAWQAKAIQQKQKSQLDTRETLQMAKIFSVKEAAFKALAGVEHPRQLVWHDAYLTYIEGTRRPVLHYSDQLKEEWRTKLGVHPPQLHLSLSHDGDYVSAFVVAVEAPPIAAKDKQS